MRGNKKILFTTNSLKGVKRAKNQDDVLIIEETNYFLFFLFDGVSSISNSYKFIQQCKRHIKQKYHNYFQQEIKLAELIFDTNKFAINHSDKPSGFTTCSAIYISKDDYQGYFFNIGDSRIYEFSNQFLEQITTDDNLPGDSRLLTKCLGYSEIKKEDFIQSRIELKSGLLICSDGFYSLMEPIKKIYFSIFQYKRCKNIFNSIDKLQSGLNSDDSTYIIIKRNGI